MGDMMTFPASVEEFMEQYKMTDTEHVYSNGTEYVPIYRMKQWFEHCHNQQPLTIDAVPVEQYNDLREDFIDYVCSGVPNPAPYCGNATEKCVDARGWCVKSECNGFTPSGERKE